MIGYRYACIYHDCNKIILISFSLLLIPENEDFRMIFLSYYFKQENKKGKSLSEKSSFSWIKSCLHKT